MQHKVKPVLVLLPCTVKTELRLWELMSLESSRARLWNLHISPDLLRREGKGGGIRGALWFPSVLPRD